VEILLFHHQTKDGEIAQERNYRKGKRRESDNAYFGETQNNARERGAVNL
jgi:hypothetical protein